MWRQDFVNNASFGAYAEIVQSSAYRGDKVGATLEAPDLLPGSAARADARGNDVLPRRRRAGLQQPVRQRDIAGQPPDGWTAASWHGRSQRGERTAGRGIIRRRNSAGISVH